MGYICPQNIFLQLKHIQRIYLTLLSTISVKIHQIAYVIFETIIHFSRDNSSVLSQTLHNFDKNISSKCKYSDFPLLKLKFIKFLMSFFKQEVSFLQSCFTFLAENLYAIDKGSTSKCKFSNLPLLALKYTNFFV